MKDEFKKIIPCLDFKNGRVVKGINFVDIIDAGDAVENAVFYESEGADELAFLDIAATLEGRKTLVDAVKKITSNIKIPLTVGGGINSVKTAEEILNAGASKVSINSAAVTNPRLISECVKEFGSSKIIVAIDVAKNSKNGYDVYVSGGTKNTGLDALEWAKQAYDLGAGGLLPTSINCDGAKTGYDLDITSAMAVACPIPVIASGGAGSMQDFLFALTNGRAAAALAASLFHFREIKIPELKKYLLQNGVKVKIN